VRHLGKSDGGTCPRRAAVGPSRSPDIS